MSGIERFEGISVPGWAGPRPGGGYEGATAELDRAVEQQAEWLRKHYPHHKVQIRFNSDRKSGGAFLQIARSDSDLGLNVAITSPGAAEFSGTPRSSLKHRYATGQLRYGVYIPVHFLSDPSKASHGFYHSETYKSEPYADEDFPTAAEARRFFARYVDLAGAGRRKNDWKKDLANGSVMKED